MLALVIFVFLRQGPAAAPAGLEGDLPASASPVWGLKVCATMPHPQFIVFRSSHLFSYPV